MYNPLQLREIFHLEFLRWFIRKIKVTHYALKGGTNLRFFFNSFRYSEDMDIDIYGVKVSVLRDIVIKILQSPVFSENLEPFEIKRVIPPNITKAKQTETTQRFKIHLITSAGEDLFTKIEFSRRGLKQGVVVETVLNTILRTYKLPPLLIPHYNLQSAAFQKINAFASRAMIQARDIFDLYILSSQYKSFKEERVEINGNKLRKACENIFEVSFEQFRDTVLPYLPSEEQILYDSASLWDEIRLKVTNFIEELGKDNA
jgi:predicted nucleotidyltransferase component of viral defense system